MLLFFDTETTGLRPGKICQISYIMQDVNGVVAKNFYFTVPFVEPSAQMVHGLSCEKLKFLSGGKTFEDSIDEIAQDFKRADCIVAHNLSFDLSFLRAEFENCGVEFRYKEGFCSMKSATPICKLTRSNGCAYKYPKLAELTAFCGITERDIKDFTWNYFGDDGDYHDARYDTSAMCLAVNKLINKGDFEDLKRYL